MTATLPALGTERWTLDDVFDRPGSVRSLAVLRIVLGPVVLVHLWPFLSMTLEGRTWQRPGVHLGSGGLRLAIGMGALDSVPKVRSQAVKKYPKCSYH